MPKKNATKLETKLREMELRLAGAESKISTRDKKVANLKVALEVSEDKFYDIGFANAENSCDLVMLQSRHYEFGEGWMAVVAAMGMPEDSPFRDPKQILYTDPPLPLVQNLVHTKDEDSQRMKELVQEINSHAELIDLEITGDLNVVQGSAQPQVPNPNFQLAVDATLL